MVKFIKENKYWILAISIILGLLTFNFYTYKQKVELTKQLELGYKNPKIKFQKGKTKIVYQDRIIERTIIKNPDGTEITTEKIIEKPKIITTEEIRRDSEHIFSKNIFNSSNWFLGFDTDYKFNFSLWQVQLGHKLFENLYFNLSFTMVEKKQYYGLGMKILF